MWTSLGLVLFVGIVVLIASFVFCSRWWTHKERMYRRLCLHQERLRSIDKGMNPWTDQADKIVTF